MDKTYEVRAKPSYCMTCKTCNKRKPSTVLQKCYSHVRCIIDCTEVFIETPSSLDTQAQCWSDNKHQYTLKFLVVITPNGMFLMYRHAMEGDHMLHLSSTTVPLYHC